MLTVHRKGSFSRDLEIRDGVAPVADITRPRFSERAELRVGTETYETRRVGWLIAAFVIERRGVEVARIEQVGVLRRSFHVHSEGRALMLKPRGAFRDGYVLADGETELVWIKRSSYWRSGFEASFPPGLDRPLQVFLLWLVVTLYGTKTAASF